MEKSMTIAVNDSNDIYLVNGDIALVTDKSAREQIIAAAIRTRRGELQLDLDRGIPYFETVFKSPSKDNLDIWEASVRDTITEFDFVSSIKNFTYEIDYERNILRYHATIVTTDEDIIELTGNV